MTVEEARSAVEELKAQGMSEDDMAASLYGMFVDDKIDLPQFEALAKVIGFELTDEFKNMSPEEQKSLAQDEEEENEGEEKPEENPFEKKEEKEEDKQQEKPENEKPEEDEEDDDEKAKKMYGFEKW